MAESKNVWKPANSPYWYCRFRVGKKSFGGSTKLTSRKEAAAFAKRWKAEKVREFEAAKPVAGSAVSAMTLLAAVDRYVRESKTRTVTSGKWDPKFDWLVAEVGEDTPLSHIDDELVARLVTRRCNMYRWNDPKHGRVARHTASQAVIVPLQAVMERARRTWKVPLPNMPDWTEHRTSCKPRRREMSFSEEAAIKAVAGDDYWRFYDFILCTGLRRAEALIDWSQVDDVAEVIRITAKGENEREVNITPAIRKLLDEAVIDGKRVGPVFHFTSDDNFARGRPRPFTYKGMTRQFKRITRKAGVQDLTIHDLRRTAGARMYRVVGDLGTVQAFLGHSSVLTTRRHYVHIKSYDVKVRQIAMEYAVDLMRRSGQVDPDA